MNDGTVSLDRADDSLVLDRTVVPAGLNRGSESDCGICPKAIAALAMSRKIGVIILGALPESI